MHLPSFACKEMELCETRADTESSHSSIMQDRVHGIVCVWINVLRVFFLCLFLIKLLPSPGFDGHSCQDENMHVGWKKKLNNCFMHLWELNLYDSIAFGSVMHMCPYVSKKSIYRGERILPLLKGFDRIFTLTDYFLRHHFYVEKHLNPNNSVKCGRS